MAWIVWFAASLLSKCFWMHLGYLYLAEKEVGRLYAMTVGRIHPHRGFTYSWGR
ncbi:hypothetical protein N658DRAFT_492923 [Parathielavia hyrcaniae]|uniref:Uncharacterized protein n=1 Tax=Parathielavia hyrcaniae TaxID=113614 RepID=A0AAN6Q740_9PEZI|nr:hypothetical protein N658DRAFT_492923 [Parathielavia hyrcaniae]